MPQREPVTHPKQLQSPQNRRAASGKQVAARRTGKTNLRTATRGRAAAARSRQQFGQRDRRWRRGPQSRLGRQRGLCDYQQGARRQLQRFRQGSMLAIAITALLLLMWGIDPEATAQDATAQDAPAAVGQTAVPATDSPESATPAVTDETDASAENTLPADESGDPVESVNQAVKTLSDLATVFYGLLPKLLIAAVLIAIAELLSRLVRWPLRWALQSWQRSEAVIALTRIGIYLLAIAVGLSIVAGDARALVGSIGLVGLALSWALQTPIESFTGWLLNSFRGYYRVGDRIEVGDVFGDVYRIDVLNTTVWEAGGPGKSVAGAQPTGAMITFPNWEVLRSNVVNYSRDFPYVWDEATISVANESDLSYTMSVLHATAERIIGAEMQVPAAQYQELLAKARLAFDIASEPQVFVSLADSWTNFTVRYLVDARQRRRWSTVLLVELTKEIARPEHRQKIVPAYPRSEVQLRGDWSAADLPANPTDAGPP